MRYSIEKEYSMGKMQWKNLLCKERARETGTKYLPFRNEFEKDYERIITSSSLRRLQDKAQVFPLQENDFTRTRLTHSLEVSSIARSLGKRIGYNLCQKGYMNEIEAEELTSMLAVCGLVHDLGNPPFGHYGEDIIKSWFDEHKDDFKDIGDKLDDFRCFDGNAQTIRILSKLQYLKDGFGINFCYGTLGTLLKYPKSSHDVIHLDKISKRKMGYFQSEKIIFENIVNKTGMKDSETGEILRHPATYLLEAADDIAYLFADLEDAVKKDYAIWEKIKQDILSVTNTLDNFKFIQLEIDKMKETNDNRLPIKDCVALEASYLKVLCQGKCIELVCNEFIENYESIMDGKYFEETQRKSLCDAPTICNIAGECADGTKGIVRRDCTQYAYENSEVLSLELIAKTVLVSLLDRFTKAAISKERTDKRTENGKLYSKISKNFILMQKFDENGEYDKHKEVDEYGHLQSAIDYIAGMTDSYALNLHKILEGMKLP